MCVYTYISIKIYHIYDICHIYHISMILKNINNTPKAHLYLKEIFNLDNWS